MTLFWIASVILVVVSVLLIALPFINKKSNIDDELRDELNKAFYKDRLEELEEETDEGLVENQQELIEDLKQSLLDDIPDSESVKQESKVSSWAVVVPSALLVIGMSYGLYFKFGASEDVMRWQEVSANLPALSKKLMAPEGATLSDDEMQDLTLALRTRLHYQPDDSTGWLLLGRIALANRDVATAVGAMKKAYNLETDNPDVMLGYAQALMLSQDDTDQDKARRLLGQLVQQDYVDLRVFSLLAFDSYERKDYPAAVRYWRAMQQMIGPQDSRYEMLSRSIENAQKQMGQKIGTGKSVAVTISIADNVSADPNSALIVTVHTADGSPMPVAAARYPLGSFPRTVVLDDGNSMIEQRKLSSLEALMVRVRLDSDGNVATKQGDWFGESEVVRMGEPVEVVIDSQFE
ncbi:c-type cytochrome biogenesis protein CcmI [Vibrio sp. M260118]|uniref:c-type cytochrome biogenesis protein CcmI n=1 Tax=Vibrio sp. M260118 TaxID=3020896 RepID=UPI002F41E399